MSDYRKKTNHSAIVFLSDIAWLEYAKQMIVSAHFNGGWQGDYVMLAIDIPEYKLEWFRDRGVYIFKCPDLADLLKVDKSQVKTTLYRIWMFSSAFLRWEYLLFLDLDIIIRGDLSCLLDHHGVMAAWDSNRNNLSWQLVGENAAMNSKISTQYQELNQSYDLSKVAFNAGVLSVHNSRFGKYAFEDICRLYKRYIDIFCSHMNDQALLNFYFYDDWVKMPSQFNVYVNFSAVNYFKKLKKINSYILHFAGTQQNHKPWHPENPYHHEWLENYNKREKFDTLEKHEARKINSYSAINEDALKIEQEWLKIRDYQRKIHSAIWWFANPHKILSRILD